ncbi:MAG: HEAT repeat domain-containing protein [Candidatus Omnitrophica bacterium]|nr:HEAT repeat domain-containing protein [Candidatus Omnitrophota bacterium]
MDETRRAIVGVRFLGLILTAYSLPLALTGCVKRTMVIESDPPGATVWINETKAGTTPLTHEFITHGRYKFRLEKTGFQELTAREMVRAPVYQWIPIDFLAEHLLPVHLEDKHLFRYQLSPASPSQRLMEEPPGRKEALQGDFKDPHPEKRRLACVEAARKRDPELAASVREAAQDPDGSVRAAALQALRGIEGTKSMEVLLKALKEDPQREVRWQAAVELEALGSADAVPALVEALKDRDSLVRTGAAEALKGLADPRAVHPLARALKDQDSSVRRAAAEGLGRMGDKAAVPALSRALFHRDVQTRRRAAEALLRLKDPSASRALVRSFSDWDPKVRKTATDALISFGNQKETVPILIRRLRAWKPWIREHAARTLGGFKDPGSLKALRLAFYREDDEEARAAMAAALQSFEKN